MNFGVTECKKVKYHFRYHNTKTVIAVDLKLSAVTRLKSQQDGFGICNGHPKLSTIILPYLFEVIMPCLEVLLLPVKQLAFLTFICTVFDHWKLIVFFFQRNNQNEIRRLTQELNRVDASAERLSTVRQELAEAVSMFCRSNITVDSVILPSHAAKG